MRLRLPLCLCLAVAGCLLEPDAGDSSLGLSGGEPASGDPGACALVDATGAAVCSCALIAPRVVATAGHCVDSAVTQVVFGEDVASPTHALDVIHVRRHRRFDPLTFEHDVAVALLDGPVPIDAYPLYTATLTDADLGARVRLVGFGQTEASAHGPSGRKHTGTSVITDILDEVFRVAPDPAQPCKGDSGGPALLTRAEGEPLVGIISGGDASCQSSARIARIDAYRESLVEPYLEATADGAAQAGERCLHPANCAAGDCFSPAAAPEMGYCSAPCAEPTDCPAGMQCAEAGGTRRCQWPTPPGSLGAPCRWHDECGEGTCGRRTLDSDTVCTRHCLPSGGALACPEGFECRVDPDEESRHLCFVAPDGSGCQAAPADAPGGLAVLLATVGLWCCRRIRARGVS